MSLNFDRQNPPCRSIANSISRPSRFPLHIQSFPHNVRAWTNHHSQGGRGMTRERPQKQNHSHNRKDYRPRRDQPTVCFAPQAARRPCAPSTVPVPLLKPWVRYERASARCRRSGGLPSAARRRALCFGCNSLGASLCPPLHFPARRPQTESLARFSAIRVAAIRLDAVKARSEPFRLCGGSGRVKDTTGRSLRRSRFRSSLTRPLAPGNFAFRFFIAGICRWAN